MKLTSSAFQNGEMIPTQYTCDGQDMCPPLEWEDVPAETQSFVLIMDDPDAPMGIWDHWIVYDIPASTRRFEEGMTELPEGSYHGLNSWGKTKWGGPCPPDREHRYFFKLYALDRALGYLGSPIKDQVLQEIRDHTLAEAELIGRYNRPENIK